MTKYVINGSNLTAIADEVRELKESAEKVSVEEMITTLQEANEEIAVQTELLVQAVEELKGKADPELYNRGFSDGVADCEPFIDSLIENTLTRLDNDRITRVNQYLCNSNTNLVEVNLPNVERIGDRAFTGCKGLTEIDFPKCTYIGTYGFQSCSKLATVNLPELKSMGGYTFQSCSALTSVYFPKLERVHTADLYNCSKMHTADLPVCTSISGTGFPYCAKLTKLILRSPTLCTVDSGAFNNTPIASGTGYIYVPDELVEEYKAATNWSTFAAQIKPISELEEGV